MWMGRRRNHFCFYLAEGFVGGLVDESQHNSHPIVLLFCVWGEWVGGWVGGWVEEKVILGCCGLAVGSGGWVGGWVGRTLKEACGAETAWSSSVTDSLCITYTEPSVVL